MNRAYYMGVHKAGEYKTVYPDGSLNYRCYFNEALQTHGPCESWYDNGTLCYRGQFKNDMHIGLWECFNYDGTLSYRGWFNDKGEKTGYWVEANYMADPELELSRVYTYSYMNLFYLENS